MSPKIFSVKEDGENSRKQIEEIVAKVCESRPNYLTLIDKVKPIVEDVRRRGDAALLEYVEKLDKISLTKDSLLVKQSELESAYKRIPSSLRKSLEYAAERIEYNSKKLLKRLKTQYRYDGVYISLNPVPVDSVGCYIPGGGASYPSTTLMTTIPAKVAGVKRIAAVSPLYDRERTTPVLAALYVAELEEVYRIGGPHAIAALAYGTESIKRVSKIVGPGGAHVTAAKLLVSRDVMIDMPAGPTELVIFCDEYADSRDVVMELCAQAEHSSDTIVGVVTTSHELAKSILKGMLTEAARLDRGEVIREAWERNGFIVLVDSEKIAADIINKIAPEHVAVFSKDPQRFAGMIEYAGMVSIGIHTSPVLCDYVIGTNHVLPTSGYAKIRGGLSVIDFICLSYHVKVNKQTAKRLSKIAKPLAIAENLTSHAEALERFR